MFELCPRIFVQPITAQFAVLKLAEQNNSWAVIDWTKNLGYSSDKTAVPFPAKKYLSIGSVIFPSKKIIESQYMKEKNPTLLALPHIWQSSL